MVSNTQQAQNQKKKKRQARPGEIEILKREMAPNVGTKENPVYDFNAPKTTTFQKDRETRLRSEAPEGSRLRTAVNPKSGINDRLTLAQARAERQGLDPTQLVRRLPGGGLGGLDDAAQAQAYEEALIQEQRDREAIAAAKDAGVFEGSPGLVDLNPVSGERAASEGSPKFLGLVEPNNPLEKFVADIFSKNTGMEGAEINDLITDPETQRQVLLQEIQRKELDKVQTSSQKIGATLEPFVGDLKVFDVDIGGYVDKFARMPKQEAEEVVEQIGEMESRISGMTDSAAQGEMGNPAEVLRTLEKEDQKLAQLEARLKVLVLHSKELRANPEKVNIIEEKILNTRTTLFEAKQRAAEGALVTPSAQNLYYKLQQKNK